MPRTPLIIVDDPKDSSNAKSAGLKGFDKIVRVDSTPVTFFDEIAGYLQHKKGDSVLLSVLRNQTAIQIKVLVDNEGKIGLNIFSDEQYDSLGIFKQETKKYSFFASFPAGVRSAEGGLSRSDVFPLPEVSTPWIPATSTSTISRLDIPGALRNLRRW